MPISLRTVVAEHSPAQIRVDSIVNTPPTHADGKRVIVGSTPTGVFIGHTWEIAWSFENTWLFDTPEPGWQCYVTAHAEDYIFHNSLWQPRIVIEAKGDLIIGGTSGIPERKAGTTTVGKNKYLRQYKDISETIETEWEDIPYTDIGNFPTQRIAGRKTAGAGALEAIELDAATMEFLGNGKLAAKVGSDVYYYLASVNNQPSIQPSGLDLLYGTSRYIALDKHGVDNKQAAWNVRVKILFHGDHQIEETRYLCAITAIYEAVIYTDFLAGNITRIGNLKVVSTNGIVSKYTQPVGAWTYDQTFILKENDVKAELIVTESNPHIKLTNNIQLNTEIGVDIPLYAKYTVETIDFYTSLTTQ